MTPDEAKRRAAEIIDALAPQWRNIASYAADQFEEAITAALIMAARDGELNRAAQVTSLLVLAESLVDQLECLAVDDADAPALPDEASYIEAMRALVTKAGEPLEVLVMTEMDSRWMCPSLKASVQKGAEACRAAAKMVVERDAKSRPKIQVD